VFYAEVNSIWSEINAFQQCGRFFIPAVLGWAVLKIVESLAEMSAKELQNVQVENRLM